MTHDLSFLVAAVVLGLVQLIGAALAKRGQEPSGWAAGARDQPQAAYHGMAARLDRAQANFMETFPFFAAAVVVCHLAGRAGALSGWGTDLYVWGRLVYIPLYAFGVPYLRTVVWVASLAGLCLVLAACLMAG